MPISPEPRREQPNTYFIQDRTLQEELDRLHVHDDNGRRVARAAHSAGKCQITNRSLSSLIDKFSISSQRGQEICWLTLSL
jgi:hypothetical protein